MRAHSVAAGTRLPWPRRAFYVLSAVSVASQVACTNPQTLLTELIEARRLASELHQQFTQAAEAANRAVMAETDDMSAAAAEEARRARQVTERDVQALRAILESLGYRDDLRYLDDFDARFNEYRRLDDEILPLAVENTNLKAQRLSFGPSREAAQRFRASLDEALKASAMKDTCCAEVVAARATTAMLEIQVTYAAHIVEAEDSAMSQMETQMTAAAARARKALGELQGRLPSEATAHLGAAAAALDQFLSVHKEIIALSRRNSDVRSLALSLGQKRKVMAECQAQLQALEEALAKHDFTATR
jgi:hypothetical protein